MAEDYEFTREIEVELDGTRYRGHYRVMSGTVIVYFEDEIKFASHDMNEPGVVARWLLTDLSRRVESRKRKASGS
ncbi:hypothetical protein [Paraburkholderia sp. BL9I2N2]|uniref:hypothetical protein n=1 Tax=Paraburkholderia sp. BL9I2N2 TaxID=1938809 RepID=UPI001052C9C6|nr:hypothetical protein [Paraburkholderia sp. BL9I2N2]TCK96957.1 hypothetical protein B0G74_3654 [Paraburkholderia sp. BL9I2N2]